MCFQEAAPIAAVEAHARSEWRPRRRECEARLNNIDRNFKRLNWSYESKKFAQVKLAYS